LVGQRGVRVGTVTSELSGEKIDIVEWNEDPALFIEEALSPAEVVSIELIDAEHRAIVIVTEDEQSLAIGKGGQNVRLAAKLTGWKIDIKSAGGATLDEEEPGEAEDEVVETKPEEKPTEAPKA
jgi:N utilization substance protein A